MNLNTPRIVRNSTGLFSLMAFSAFLIYYFECYIFDANANVTSYYTEILFFLMPILAAVSMLPIFAKKGFALTLLTGFLYSLTWLLWFFPYYAFLYAYQYILIGDVLLLATIESLFMMFLFFIQTMLIFLIMILFTRIFARKERGQFSFLKHLSKIGATDFSIPITAGIFVGSIAMFVYKIVLLLNNEIIPGIVDGNYTTEKILILCARFIFLLALLIVSHILACKRKDKLIKIISEE